MVPTWYLLSDGELCRRRNQNHTQAKGGFVITMEYHSIGGHFLAGEVDTTRRLPPYIVKPYLERVFLCVAPRLLLLVAC